MECGLLFDNVGTFKYVPEHKVVDDISLSHRLMFKIHEQRKTMIGLLCTQNQCASIYSLYNSS
jgi:hypothetical protein